MAKNRANTVKLVYVYVSVYVRRDFFVVVGVALGGDGGILDVHVWSR